MPDIDEKTLQYHSMPIHNPFFRTQAVSFRGNIVKAELIIHKPELIAGIVPEPLIYNDNKAFIVLLEVTELKEGFSEEHTLWTEIALQIPVIHNAEPGLYVCENYCTDIRGIISARETYGYPKVPGQILIHKDNTEFNAKLLKYGSNKEIMKLSYQVLHETPSRMGPPPGGISTKMPKIILLKYIPSATLGQKPDVKQLVAMKYKKPVIHKHSIGEGEIEILDGAPSYLKDLGTPKTAHISCFDMETNLIGGDILHNYNS